MWGGVLSLVRQGLLRRRRSMRPRRRTRTTARVVDESALGEAADATTAVDVAAAHAGVPGAQQLARAVLAMARGAVVRLDGGAEEAWAAASGWRPARAAGDELVVGHLMARESLRYVIYA